MEQVEVSLDDGKHVVEVVRKPTGQLANDLHLLGLPQLRFDGLPFGHIGVDGYEATGRDRIGPKLENPPAG